MEQILYSSAEGRPTLDPSRLEALEGLAILDKKLSAPFERLVRIAQETIRVPVVLISLVDDHRQFFLSQVGLPDSWAAEGETPFSHSFCRHVVDLGEPLLVEDARSHSVLKDNLAIRDLGVIAYAGVPIASSEGHVLGAFSVIDTEPRSWTSSEVDLIKAFAAGASASLELLSEKEIAVRLAEELEESRVLVRQVTENMDDVLWLLDTETFRLIYVSENAAKMWDITAEEFIEDVSRFREKIHPADLPQLEVLFANAFKGQVSAAEYRIIRSDGSQRWLKTRFFPMFDDQGQQYRVVGSTEDFTQRREMEQQLLQAQKMQAVGQLAAGIAHDFNNLLAVILGGAEMLSEEVEGEDLQTISEAARRGAEIVAQLLTFSKQQQLAPETLDLNSVLQDMQPLIKQTVREDVELIFNLAPSLPPVRIDPGALDQVVVNLLVNAKEAMPTGGTVAVKTTSTQVDEYFSEMHGGIEPGLYACLTVSDTGRGMDEDVRSHAFEPYFTTKSAWESGGLGLSTVLGVIERSGGATSLYSEPGVGTTVKVYLPAATTTVKELPARAKDEPGKGEKLLVVEDNELMLRILMRMLESSGYSPVAARTGREAFDRVEREGPFDAVITDVVMPGMSGRDLMGRLQAAGYPGKIIFMSGYTSEILDRHGELPAEVHYLQKPFTRSEVLTVLSSALRGA